MYDGIMLRKDTLVWKICVRSQLSLRGKTPFLTGGGLRDTHIKIHHFIGASHKPCISVFYRLGLMEED